MAAYGQLVMAADRSPGRNGVTHAAACLAERGSVVRDMVARIRKRTPLREP